MAETKVLGLPALRDALKELPAKLQKRALRNALAAAGRVVRDGARASFKSSSRANATQRKSSPYRQPGTVLKAISVRTSKNARKAGDVGVFVNVKPAKAGSRGAKNPKDPFYWRWLEFGWTPASGARTASAKRTRRKDSGAPAIPGRGFLQAGAKRLSEALEVFKKQIGPAIQRLNTKGVKE